MNAEQTPGPLAGGGPWGVLIVSAKIRRTQEYLRLKTINWGSFLSTFIYRKKLPPAHFFDVMLISAEKCK